MWRLAPLNGLLTIRLSAVGAQVPRVDSPSCWQVDSTALRLPAPCGYPPIDPITSMLLRIYLPWLMPALFSSACPVTRSYAHLRMRNAHACPYTTCYTYGALLRAIRGNELTWGYYVPVCVYR